jgi:phosphodiesterase/alkaline phosphatase D-like protein
MLWYTTAANRKVIFIEEENAMNNIWITADAHLATVFKFVPFEDNPDFIIHEIVTGPLHARLIPIDIFDETLVPERLFYWSPEKKYHFRTNLLQN